MLDLDLIEKFGKAIEAARAKSSLKNQATALTAAMADAYVVLYEIKGEANDTDLRTLGFTFQEIIDLHRDAYAAAAKRVVRQVQDDAPIAA